MVSERLWLAAHAPHYLVQRDYNAELAKLPVYDPKWPEPMRAQWMEAVMHLLTRSTSSDAQARLAWADAMLAVAQEPKP